MAEITADDIISLGHQDRAQSSAAVSSDIDASPDNAIRSMELSRSSGVDAPVIYDALDDFERDYKSRMASQVVNNNPHLSQFVRSGPMVPKLFNQQYSNLDEASQKATSLADLAPKPLSDWLRSDSIARGAVHGWHRGFGDQPISGMLLPGTMGPGYELSEAVARAEVTVPELALRTISAAINAGASALLGEDEGEKAAAYLMDPGLQATLHGLGPPGAIAAGLLSGLSKVRPMGVPRLEGEVVQRPHVLDEGAVVSPQAQPGVADSMKRAMFWASRDKEPPPTVLPEYDKFLEQENKANIDKLGELIDASSEPREVDRELYSRFIAQHTPGEFTISGDAAVRLYGEKLPSADDNLLGWVPGMAEQLELAKQTGADIVVPTAKAAAYMESDVLKALQDDIRMTPRGITANEAKLSSDLDEASPLPIPVDGELPERRAASALEPMLSVGDRQIRIEKRPVAMAGDVIGADQWRLLDEKGNKVGHLELSPFEGGKKLYVDVVQGLNGLGPRDFGPALMRSLLKQIKEAYPNAEQIGGFRISGARERAGTEKEAWIRLDNPDIEQFQQVLEGGQWETYSRSIKAYIKPFAERSAEDRAFVDIINDELARIVPKKLAVQEADRIVAKGAEGQVGEVRPTGAYVTYRGTYPILLYALEGDDPLGTVRHEAIHHLRGYGFFDKAEWGTLEKAAHELGWMDQFNIKERYPTLNHALRLEESIADAYKEWEANREFAVPPEVHTLFERMKAFFEAIRERVSQLLGKPATWEDIFEKVSTGEVGSREGTKPLDARAFDERLSVSEPPEGSRPFQRAASFGIPVSHFREYDKLMQTQFAQDLKFATDRALKEKGREQTKQWKEDRKALRVEVADNIRQRPDVAADLFFGAGELYGKKVPLGSVKIDVAKLSDEQKMGLPRNYYSDKGMAPDEVAGLFGYASGDAMVADLIRYNSAKLAAGGMSAKDFASKVIDTETDRQMNFRHGVLEDNIMDAAKEHALGETAQDIVHMDTLFYANKMNAGKGLGEAELPASRGNISAAVKEVFRDTPLRQIDSDRMMAKIGSVGRQIEAFHRAEDWASAFKLAQQREQMMTIAKEMIAVEKARKKFDKITKPLAKPFDPQKKQVIDPGYSLAMRDIMSKLEKPYGMSVQGKAEAMNDLGFGNLQGFVKDFKETHADEGLELPVPDFLFDERFKKPVEDLTVDEFNEVNAAVTALNTMGRSVHKINLAGRREDLAEVVAKGNEQLQQRFPAVSKDYAKAEGGPGKVRQALAAMTTAETILARFDGRDPYGHFTKLITYPGAAASNAKDRLIRDFSAKWDKLPELVDPDKKLDAPLRDPTTGQKLTDFTRANLMTIIHNMGNDYNWRIFTKGWNIDPDVLKAWVESVATPDMFDRAQAMGKIFSEGFDMTRNVYSNIYGIPPERIPIRPITLGGKEYEGWYHPLIRDEIRSPLNKDDPSAPVYKDFWPSTANAYTKRRSGAVYTISLSQDMIPVKMNQMLHDIAFREFVHDTAKLFRNEAFKRGIATHYGPEYMDTLEVWLKNVAGAASYDSKGMAEAARLSAKLRQNVIATYIGFSATTVQKHGLTALVFSGVEGGGAKRFARAFAETTPAIFRGAVMDIFGKSPDLGNSIAKFVKKESEEIQRRDLNFRETVMGQHEVQLGRGTARQEIIRMGSKAVAFSDTISAVPTWWGRYQMALEETGGDIELSTYAADRAVRRAHGSTSITNQPAITMSRGILDPWLHTIYGFWGTKLQRTIELAHDVNDAYKLGRAGELDQVARMAPSILARTAVFVFWPAIVEQIVASQFEEDKHPKTTFLANALTMALGTPAMSIAQSVIGIRDIAYGLQHEREPQVGLVSSPLHDITQLVRDVRKDRPLDKHNAGKLIQDAITVFGDVTGMAPKHVGTAIHYAHDVIRGSQKPKTAGDVYRGVITGKQERSLH